MKARPQRMIAALTVALACSAVLAGGANADQRPDNRAGIHGIGSQSTEFSNVFTQVRPDDRAGLRGVGGTRVGITSTSTAVERTDVVDRAVLRHNASAAPRPDDRGGLRGIGTALADAAPAATTVSAGFQWSDAGFGAAAALALVLILAGIAVARTSHHRGQAVLD